MLDAIGHDVAVDFKRHKEGRRMGWDFETDADFQEKLDWAFEFVVAECRAASSFVPPPARRPVRL